MSVFSKISFQKIVIKLFFGKNSDDKRTDLQHCAETELGFQLEQRLASVMTELQVCLLAVLS